MACRLQCTLVSNGFVWSQRLLGIAVLISLVLLTGCGYVSRRQAYASARTTLDVDVEALPMPPGSVVLARRDGVTTGRVEACAGVKTELLLGNDLPKENIYRFYRDELSARGWEEVLKGEHGVTLVKDKATIEVSDLYYVSAVMGQDKIEGYEAQFRSLVLVDMTRGVFEFRACEEAVKKEETRAWRLLDKP